MYSRSVGVVGCTENPLLISSIAVRKVLPNCYMCGKFDKLLNRRTGADAE